MPSRYICSVLDEIRECTKTQNYSYLLGLVEEAQVLANRMEAALSDKKDMRYNLEKHRELKEDIKRLQKEKKKLEGKKQGGSSDE